MEEAAQYNRKLSGYNESLQLFINLVARFRKNSIFTPLKINILLEKSLLNQDKKYA